MDAFLLVLGALLCGISLLAFCIELFAERRKVAAERDWEGLFRKIWQIGRVGLLGFLTIAVVILSRDPDTGLRVLAIPLGIVGASAPLIHLIASWRASSNEGLRSERWQRLADRSGQALMAYCYMLALAFALYFVFTTQSSVEHLSQRVKTLEEAQQMSGE